MNSSLQRLEQGKLYYSISEVCRITGLEPHVLRYWETEFPQMRPRKNRAGNRAYRSKEIQYIHFIRQLLHDEKYTIQGAKKKLADVSPEEVAGQLTLLRPEPAPIPVAVPEFVGSKSSVEADRLFRNELEHVRNGLRDVLKLLNV
jgi:DNA-binding transcriptional MerR regulator